MPTPDARPGTEGAGETAERGILCAYCGDYATYATTDEAALEAARQTMIAHDAACPRNPLVTRIRELESAAEARAALLADAPVVWVTTDADGLSGSRVFATEQFADPDGTFWPDEDCAFLDTALTRPGACVRYRLVPDPEETP